MPTTDYSYADSPELRARKERIAMAKTRVGDQQFAATDMQRSLGMNDRLAYDVNISAQAGAEQMVPERNTPDDILRYLEAYDKLREEMTAEVSKQVVSDPEYFAQRYGQQPTQEMQAASDGVPAGTAEEIAARSDFGAPTTTGIGPQEVPTEFEKIKPADELGSQPSQQVPEQAGLEAGLPPQDPNNPVANRVRGVEFSGVRVIPGAQDTPEWNGILQRAANAYRPSVPDFLGRRTTSRTLCPRGPHGGHGRTDGSKRVE